MIPLTAVLASEPGAPGGPLVDWLAWAGTDREVRRWRREGCAEDGLFAASLAPSARGALAQLSDPTVYAAEVRILDGHELPVLEFREAIVFTNPTDRPLEVVRLRVFPNLVDPQRPVRILGVWGNGTPTPFLVEDSILAVRLPEPLGPGRTVRLLLQGFEPVMPFFPGAPLDAVGWSAARGGVMGVADDQLSLGLFLPTLTAFGPDGQDTRAVGWNEVPAVYDPALWHVSVTHGARWTVASTGVGIGSTADERLVTDTLVAGGARDFAVHLVPDAVVSSVQVGPTTLRVLTRSLEGDELVGPDLLQVGEAALRVFSERFGPPLPAEVDLVEGPVRGLPALDFPGLVVVDTRHAHRPYHRSARHEWALVHGLAHQWWGHEVGSDGVAEPWIDEGLAEHATALYWESRYGRDAVVDRFEVELLEPLGRMVARGLKVLPGNLPADAYDLGRYSVLVHGRAAMFFDGLRRAYGDEAWTQTLLALRVAGSGRRLGGAEVLEVLGRTAPEGVDPEALFLEQMVSPTWLEDLVGATPGP